MTNHLSSQEFVDASEGTLSPKREAHVAECASCRAEVAVLAEAVQTLKLDAVPEPSPLFWDHFQHRVQGAVRDGAAEPARGGVAGWPRWQVFGGAAAVVASLAMAVTLYTRPGVPGASSESASAVPASFDPFSVSEDAGMVSDGATSSSVGQEWEFVTSVLGTLEADDVQTVLAPSSRAVDAAFEGLSNKERDEFLRLLRVEMAEGME